MRSIGSGLCCSGGARICRFHGASVIAVSISSGSTPQRVECSVMLGSGRERNTELESSRAALWSPRPANPRFFKRMEAKEEKLSTVEAAMFLVLGAGTCRCLDEVCDKLKGVRSTGGLGICIARKPFSFEGHRRRKEAERTLATLKAVSDLLLVIDHDRLLTREGLTLMEATRISNNMVSLGTKAISQLLSDQKALVYDGLGNTEYSTVEMVRQLSGDANLRYGSGLSVAEAAKQACDMFPMSDAESKGLIICAIAKPTRVQKHEMLAVIGVLRSAFKSEAAIAFFPMLDSNSVTGGHQVVLISARVECGTPAVSSFVGKTSTYESSRSQTSCSLSADVFHVTNSTSHCFRAAQTSSPTETQRHSKTHKTSSEKDWKSWEAGPFSDSATAWAQSRSQATNERPIAAGGPTQGSSFLELQANKVNVLQPLPCDPAAVPNSSVLRMGFDAVLDACSEFIQDRDRKNDRSLSQRAASMLENERSPRSLSPPLEMCFQGGLYRGRCEGGQPDGKGRLTFADGSFYEGDWSRGKRNGMGTFYYANGDVYQGPWSDNFMHGEGWFYFRSGDRLHADFVRGKAHGQGRYFSSDGSVFFGQFRENVRHGKGTSCDSLGTRWYEKWHSGALISRQEYV